LLTNWFVLALPVIMIVVGSLDSTAQSKSSYLKILLSSRLKNQTKIEIFL
jgi:hypothetical protein